MYAYMFPDFLLLALFLTVYINIYINFELTNGGLQMWRIQELRCAKQTTLINAQGYRFYITDS